MATLYSDPRPQVLDDNGNPVSGAKLLAYEAGTTTPRDVYSDAALSSVISQPVVADSAGRLPDIYLSANDYKFVLTDASDVTIWTQDDYTPPASGSTNLLNGIATQAAARTAIGAASATDVSSNTTTLATISSQIAAIPGAALNDMAGEPDVGVDNLATGFGVVCLQRDTYTNSASTSISSMPEDGTVPQNTEGTSIFDEDITPQSETSKIVVKGIINFDASSDASAMVAVFLGGSTSAQRTFVSSHSRDSSVPFEYEYDHGSLSSVNVLIRAGEGGGTILLNSASLFGASSVSSLVIEEWETK